jgi:hypothetical protein
MENYILRTCKNEAQNEVFLTFQAALLLCSFVLVIIIMATVYYCKRHGGSGRPLSASDLKSSVKSVGLADALRNLGSRTRSFLRSHFGIRFLLWKTDDWKNIREDVLQVGTVAEHNKAQP